jgi:hypothetical protein
MKASRAASSSKGTKKKKGWVLSTLIQWEGKRKQTTTSAAFCTMCTACNHQCALCHACK